MTGCFRGFQAKSLHPLVRSAWQPAQCDPGQILEAGGSPSSRGGTGREEEHHLQEEMESLRADRESLRVQLEEAQAQLAEAREALAAFGRAACSGCRLRGAMLSQSTSPEELKQAIGGVEALLDEARRELGRKEHTRRRAAFEALHLAQARGTDAQLAQAIEVAHAAGLDSDDVTKAETQLLELRALTPEQRAAKAKALLEAERKREAFQLAKKDLADGLATLLESLDEGSRWQDWKDYSGRTLHQLAHELRSVKVMDMLRVRFHLPARPRMSHGPERLAESCQDVRQAAPTAALPSRGVAPAAAEASRRETSTSTGFATSTTGAPSLASSPNVASAQASPGNLELAQAKAMRAVVQDDTLALQEVLATTPLPIWSRWVNRAGKDMLTLADERGSSNTYSLLAKALGLVQELKREVFEERECVWVFMPGDVQARRATVLEEVSEELDEVLVEFWDGDESPRKVDRCLVRKGAS